MSSTNTYTEQKYCVYITHYLGNALLPKTESTISPSNYIGSTSVDKINNGYKGSVCSEQYRYIWESELNNNPHLFSIEIISYHDTRPEAYHKELQLQQMFNVVTNPLFVNKAYAKNNGHFGTCDPVRSSNTQKELIANGTHHFLSEDFKQAQSKKQKELVANGTHRLLNGELQTKNNYDRVEKGEHVSQIKVNCIYCRTEIDRLNFIKYHGDNCTQSPMYSPTIYSCLYCNFTSKNKSTITAFHNENCKLSPNCNPIIYTCIHCGKQITSLLNYNKWHNDNCKHKP